MEIAIGVLGLIIAWFTYQKTFLAEPKDEKDNLLANIKANQNLSREILAKLTEFGNKHNAFDEIMFCKVPLRKYIDTMRIEHSKNLSDEMYDKVKNSKLTKPLIESMTKSIIAQQEDLIKVQTAIKLYLEDTNN
ncbi:MAG: hypothetical protein H7Y13_17685 [Sphingobacteriaceae bacterium]|nr:hypothetical protein [Sphingobacteriaceae bacterium]